MIIKTWVIKYNDFAIQVVSSSGMSSTPPYNDPTAILGRPTLNFVDVFDGGGTNRTSIIDPPYNVVPDGSNVIAEIEAGGQITVMMGRKVYHDPNNPYGIDLIVFGNSFFSASDTSGTISDLTDLDTAELSSGIFGHSATVSVSQDGTNWYAFSNAPVLFPDNAYRWDYPNHSWTDDGEEEDREYAAGDQHRPDAVMDDPGDERQVIFQIVGCVERHGIIPDLNGLQQQADLENEERDHRGDLQP